MRESETHTCTYQTSAECLTHLADRTCKRAKLGARLAALLQLALQPAEDVVEAHRALASPQTALCARAHASSAHWAAMAAAAVESGKVGAQAHRILGREHEEDATRDLVMDDRLVVVADDVDAELDQILRVQLKHVRLDTLGAEPLGIDEGAVGGLDVLDVDLSDPGFRPRARGTPMTAGPSHLHIELMTGTHVALTLPSCDHTSACMRLSTLLSK